MACMTYKRPLEQDPMHNYQSGPTKRARFSQSHQGIPSSSTPAADPRASPHHHQQHHLTQPSAVGASSPFGELANKMTYDKMAANIREEAQRLKRRLRFGNAGAGFEGGCCDADGGDRHRYAQPLDADDQQLFTYTQVGYICQRMLDEQEQRIREEYDKLLADRLAEQYDTFIKFTQDQIQAKFQIQREPTYLS